MGQRANLVVVRNKSYTLYYSHWCANTLPGDIFWGEQYALAFVEMQLEVDESGWLNDIWAEGGAVLDFDQKKLLLYGGEDILYNIPLRNLYLRLMRIIWHGWSIQWAYEGITDLAAYVGYPKENVLTGYEEEVNNGSLGPPEEKSWVDTVASVKFTENEMLFFPLCGGIEGYLFYGPELINTIDKSNGYRNLRLGEWTEQFPVGGFHIDLTSKKLEYWHANDIPNLSHKVKSRWSDWTVVNHADNYESHDQSCDGLFTFPVVHCQRLLEELRSILLREASNPLDMLAMFAKRETDAGKRVEINPYALRNDRYELPKQVREEMLDAALNKL